MTSSQMNPEVVGPLFRLKTGTDAATPSTNGVIAQNLLRLSSLLEDESYKILAQQTCSAFSVEILQHPFLFVNLLDVIVGLEVGVKTVTGVVGNAGPASASGAGGVTGEEGSRAPGAVARASVSTAEKMVIKKMREQAGAAESTSTAVTSLVEVVESHAPAGPGVRNRTAWLRRRNHLLKDVPLGKNFLLVCETGSCKTVDV